VQIEYSTKLFESLDTKFNYLERDLQNLHKDIHSKKENISKNEEL